MKQDTGALTGQRYRVIVSTDIGGSDPDDFQSMVHYLLYADAFDTEGLLSSPFGAGTVNDIYAVIDQYEKDYSHLCRHSPSYPTPAYLRSITKQGEPQVAPWQGYRKPTEASDWIIQCARKKDERPLYILVWGLLEDVAQALHDAPDILPKLRVYYIGGPNKKWGLNAYEYIRQNFPELWIIENNSTYRGWFVGGNQEGDLGNQSFVSAHAAGSGALGEYFAGHLGGVIKMGDTPSVAWLLHGTPQQPENPSWGGSFVRVHNRPKKVQMGHPSEEDTVEVFGVVELVLRGPDWTPAEGKAPFQLLFDGQELDGIYCGNGEYRVRFMPKMTGLYTYSVRSDIPELDGQTGAITSVEETESGRAGDQSAYPHWWSDRLEPALCEGPHKGAKTVSQWREAWLRDFQARFRRCRR